MSEDKNNKKANLKAFSFFKCILGAFQSFNNLNFSYETILLTMHYLDHIILSCTLNIFLILTMSYPCFCYFWKIIEFITMKLVDDSTFLSRSREFCKHFLQKAKLYHTWFLLYNVFTNSLRRNLLNKSCCKTYDNFTMIPH